MIRTKQKKWCNGYNFSCRRRAQRTKKALKLGLYVMYLDFWNAIMLNWVIRMKLTVPIFQAEFDALTRFSGILPTGDFPAWVLLVQAINYFFRHCYSEQWKREKAWQQRGLLSRIMHIFSATLKKLWGNVCAYSMNYDPDKQANGQRRPK